MFVLKYKAIGLEIAYWRRRRELTQYQLAEKVGISTNYLGMIERGNNGKSYSMDVLLRLAEALDVDVQEFMREP